MKGGQPKVDQGKEGAKHLAPYRIAAHKDPSQFETGSLLHRQAVGNPFAEEWAAHGQVRDDQRAGHAEF